MYFNATIIKKNQNLTTAPSRLIIENSLLTSFAPSVTFTVCSLHRFNSTSRTAEIIKGSAVQPKARKKSETSQAKSKSAFFIEKIINLIMRDGEKSKASQIFYKTLTIITEKKFNENSILPSTFVSNQGKAKPLVFQKQEVQRVTSHLLFKKIYSPRAYPPREPLFFQSMLLSDKSRSALQHKLQHKTKSFFYTISFRKPEGKSTVKLTGFAGLLVPKQVLLEKGYLTKKVAKTTQTKVMPDRKSKLTSSSTLLAVLGLLSFTGKNLLNEKLATIFSVLKAKARPIVFTKVVKVISDALPKSIYNNLSKQSTVKHALVMNSTPTTTFPTMEGPLGTKVTGNLLLSAWLTQQEQEKKAKANNKHIKTRGLPSKLVSAYVKKSVKASNSFVVNNTQGQLDPGNKQQIALQIVKIAINNVKPSLEVRKVRIAGTTYQVPAILDKKKSISQGIRWIIESARTRKNRSKSTFSICLAEEFLDAFQKQGKARQKRDQLHNIASANRAYVRYRWW